MAALGVNVLAYDHRGHGRSPGKRGSLTSRNDLVSDLSSVVRFAKATFPESTVGLFGHSLGGLIAARYAAIQIRSKIDACSLPSADLPFDVNASNAIDFCAFTSPAFALNLNPLQRFLLQSLGTYFPKVTVGNGLKPQWLSSASNVVEQYQKDPLVHRKVSGELVQFMLESIAWVQETAPHWSLPTLLLYATGDRCVDPSGAQRFAALAPKEYVESHAIETTSHEVLSDPSRIAIDSLLDWLQRQI